MANRVVMDSNGLRVSKPGFNVLTTGSVNLLFDSSSDMVQVVDSGFLSNVSSTSPRTVNSPDLGYRPFVWAYSTHEFVVPRMEFLSNTQFRFRSSSGIHNIDIYYTVLNLRWQP